MAKKKEFEFSPTSRERKALRKSQSTDTEEKLRDEPVPEVEPMPDGVAVQTKTSRWDKKSITILCVSVVLGLLLILTAILLPFVINKGESSKYPRATITLEDGRKLTMTIWEEECPIAASNFIFLAQIGFFDGVMIHNVQPNHSFMQFGAYKSYLSGDTRYEDADFIANIPRSKFNIVNITDSQDRVTAESKKFGYRLMKDTSNDINRYGEPYVVSFNYNNAADFVINLGENNTEFSNQKGQNNIRSYLVAFAKFEDEESQKILDDIFDLPKDANTGNDNFVGTAPSIKIESVKVSNLDSSKWKNFEFVSYMNTAYNGNTAIRHWVG